MIMSSALLIFVACIILGLLSGGLCSLDDGVIISSLSSCGDIAEVRRSRITIPQTYPASLFLNTPRSCRFEIQNRGQQSVAGSQLRATLEFPFNLPADDALVFIDGNVRSHYPNTCDHNIFTKTDPLIKVIRPSSISTQYTFSSTGSSMVIDYCGSGKADGPVNILVVLTVQSAPTATDASAVHHLVPVQNQLTRHLSGGSPTQYYDIGSPMNFQQLPAAAPVVNTATNTATCGVTYAPPDRSRIVNGEVAHYGNFPWLAALVHKKYKQYCGGTILNSDWILTAAHCIIGPLDFRDIQANTTVTIGALDLNQATANNKYEIAELVVHPNYDPKGWLNDIALLRLKRSIPFFDDSQHSACLPNRSLKDAVAATGHTQCFIAGWGYTKEGMGINVFRTPLGPEPAVTSPPFGPHVGAGSDILLYGRLYFVPLETCQQNYQTGGLLLQGAPQHVRDNMLCASNDVRFQGACLGDSGGGLYCKEADETWTVHGVASWSGGCARKDLPSVFANVFQLKTLIQRVLNRKVPG